MLCFRHHSQGEAAAWGRAGDEAEMPSGAASLTAPLPCVGELNLTLGLHHSIDFAAEQL